MKNKNLDLMPVSKLVSLFLAKEADTINSLKKQRSNISKAINKILLKINKGGRIIYIGSGTSGRLGILDAVECKPTFSTELFSGIIAGGKDAIFTAKEGAEDNSTLAVKDLKKIKPTKNDVVIGISASGETPYTLSAIKLCKKKKLLTIGITTNSKSTLAKISNCKICPDIKGEIISGSSRLSSGTAQKIILNMLSSISMIKSGKVYKDLMIDVQPTNKKLIQRAVRIISIICKVPLNKASLLFLKARKNTKAAIVMHYKNCDLSTALRLLKVTKSDLRKIIG